MNQTTGVAVLASLIAAVDRHDLDGILEHFTPDVRSETPAHPGRSFTGREQVRENWAQILGTIKEVRATTRTIGSTASTTPGVETVWAEIAFDGGRPDGAPWQMRGVTVNEIVAGRIAALRLYLEPIDDDGVAAGPAVRALVGADPRR